jgi:hypothetical protein
LRINSKKEKRPGAEIEGERRRRTGMDQSHPLHPELYELKNKANVNLMISERRRTVEQKAYAGVSRAGQGSYDEQQDLSGADT